MKIFTVRNKILTVRHENKSQLLAEMAFHAKVIIVSLLSTMLPLFIFRPYIKSDGVMRSLQFSSDKYVKGLVSIMFSICSKNVCNSSKLRLILHFFVTMILTLL